MAIHDAFKRTIGDGAQLDDGYFNSLSALVPVGTIFPWAKNIAGVPALPTGWMECNGDPISNADSPMDGENTPNLNGGTYRMLRGESTSGGTGGADTHNHQWLENGGAGGGDSTFDSAGTGAAFATGNYIAAGVTLTNDTGNQTKNNSDTYTANESTLPAHYDVVWIIRIL